MTKARDIADSELGSLTVNTDTLVVDETNNRVGIGASSPSQALDVNGTSNATNLTRGGSQVYSRDNILGTVSESSGVPTGAIIERGSNANGEFIRYADGTQICWTPFSLGFKLPDLLSFGAFDNWTFPIAFLADQYVVAGVADGGINNNIVPWAGSFSSGTRVRFRANGDVSSLTLHLSAIGRWY